MSRKRAQLQLLLTGVCLDTPQPPPPAHHHYWSHQKQKTFQWPDVTPRLTRFPPSMPKTVEEKFKWNTRKEQSKDIHYLKIIQTVSSPRCPPNTFRQPIPVARTPNNSPGEAGEQSCTEPIRLRPKTSNETTNALVINNATGDDQSLIFPTSEAKSMKWHC